MAEDQSALDAIERANEVAEAGVREKPEAEAQVLAAEKATDEEDAELERSIFGDGREFGATKIKAWSAEVTLRGGTTFFLRELSRAELTVQMAMAKRLQASARRIEAMPDGKKEAVRAETDTEAEAILHQAATAREEEGQRVADEVVEFNRRVVEASLRDWSNPKWKKRVPCTRETRAELTPSIAAELCDAILSKSRSGRAATDFLSR